MSITKKIREDRRPQTSGREFRPSIQITEAADWERVDAEQLRSTVATVAVNGGALRLGYTRDGGAYSVGIYGDGPEPYTIYIKPNENVDETLQELEQTFHKRNQRPELP